jgi:polysaccharide export outer membrane protein
MYLSRPLSRHLSVLAITALLAGCSTLPRDGPTGRAVENGASNIYGHANYTIVDLDYATSERINLQPPRFWGSLAGSGTNEVGGLIGSGDSLAITIFEPGGALFGGGSTSAGVRSGAQNLPAATVTSAGTVAIPFAGQVQVAGLTTTEAASAIRRALIGKVGNPQVLVTIAENASNTVTVLGEVRSPGRVPISSNLNRVVDVIASRGGVARPPEDVLVAINRGGETYTAPLTAVTTDFTENVRLARGDQVNLIYRPRRFSTFGALGAVTQVEMGAGVLNLTGALSKVGGLDTNSANARSVLVFRFERPEIAQALGLRQPATNRGVPVVYRLSLEDAAGFFVANNFVIQADDVIYVPRSGSAELGKFFTLVRTLTGAIYDISVTSALNTNN